MIVALVLFVFAQVSPPQPPGLPSIPITPARPSSSAPATIPAQQQAPEMTDERIGKIGVTLLGAATTEVANESTALWKKTSDLPGAIFDRSRGNSVDEQHSADVNNGLKRLLPGLILAALAATGAANILGALVGRDVGPLGSIYGMMPVALAGWAAANNRWVLGYAVDGAGMILKAVSTVPINQFMQPGIGIAQFGSVILQGVIAVLYVVIGLALKFVYSIELAWLMLLSALAPLWVLAKFVPGLSGIGSYFASRWLGTLLSPLLGLTALHMGSPIVGDGSGVPDVVDQLKRIAFLFVAYQSPGFMVGAISVKVPGITDLYFAGRVVGALRYAPPARAGSSGGSGGGGATSAGPPAPAPLPRPTPVPTAFSGQNYGTGGAVAATGKRAGVP